MKLLNGFFNIFANVNDGYLISVDVEQLCDSNNGDNINNIKNKNKNSYLLLSDKVKNVIKKSFLSYQQHGDIRQKQLSKKTIVLEDNNNK